MVASAQSTIHQSPITIHTTATRESPQTSYPPPSRSIPNEIPQADGLHLVAGFPGSRTFKLRHFLVNADRGTPVRPLLENARGIEAGLIEPEILPFRGSLPGGIRRTFA